MRRTKRRTNTTRCQSQRAAWRRKWGTLKQYGQTKALRSPPWLTWQALSRYSHFKSSITKVNHRSTRLRQVTSSFWIITITVGNNLLALMEKLPPTRQISVALLTNACQWKPLANKMQQQTSWASQPTSLLPHSRRSTSETATWCLSVRPTSIKLLTIQVLKR